MTSPSISPLKWEASPIVSWKSRILNCAVCARTTVASAGFYEPLLQSVLAEAGENDEFAGDCLGVALWPAVTISLQETSLGRADESRSSSTSRSVHEKAQNWDSERVGKPWK